MVYFFFLQPNTSALLRILLLTHTCTHAQPVHTYNRREQNSGSARTVRAYYSDDEICVTRTVRYPLRMCKKGTQSPYPGGHGGDITSKL